MNNLQAAFNTAVPGIIMNLKKRNIEAFYYENSTAMVEDILTKIPAAPFPGADPNLSGNAVSWTPSRTVPTL